MVTITVRGANEVVQRMEVAVAAIMRPLAVFKLLALIGVRAVQSNFRAQKNADGSPWPRLKYRVGTPLVDKLGRMPKGITSHIEPDGVTIGAGYATRAYNAIHNFGGQAGRNGATTIPQREYMYFSQKDREAMVSEVRSFVLRSLSGRA